MLLAAPAIILPHLLFNAVSLFFFGAHQRNWSFIGLWILYTCSMIALTQVNQWIVFVFFWETISILSFLMIGEAGTNALLVNLFGGVCLLASGGSNAILLAIGILTKSAQFPFHQWIYQVSKAPDYLSAYLHAATLVQCGLILLSRLPGHFEYLDSILWHSGFITALSCLFNHQDKHLVVCATQVFLATSLMTYATNHEPLWSEIIFHMQYKPVLFLMLSRLADPFWWVTGFLHACCALWHTDYLPISIIYVKIIQYLYHRQPYTPPMKVKYLYLLWPCLLAALYISVATHNAFLNNIISLAKFQIFMNIQDFDTLFALGVICIIGIATAYCSISLSGAFIISLNPVITFIGGLISANTIIYLAVFSAVLFLKLEQLTLLWLGLVCSRINFTPLPQLPAIPSLPACPKLDLRFCCAICCIPGLYLAHIDWNIICATLLAICAIYQPLMAFVLLNWLATTLMHAAPDVLMTQITVDALVILYMLNAPQAPQINSFNFCLAVLFAICLYSCVADPQLYPLVNFTSHPVNTIVADKRALDTWVEISVFAIAGLLSHHTSGITRDPSAKFWAFRFFRQLLLTITIMFVLRGELYGAYLACCATLLAAPFGLMLAILMAWNLTGHAGGFAAGIGYGFYLFTSNTRCTSLPLIAMAILVQFSQWHFFGIHGVYSSAWLFELCIAFVVSSSVQAILRTHALRSDSARPDLLD